MASSLAVQLGRGLYRLWRTQTEMGAVDLLMDGTDTRMGVVVRGIMIGLFLTLRRSMGERTVAYPRAVLLDQTGTGNGLTALVLIPTLLMLDVGSGGVDREEGREGEEDLVMDLDSRGAGEGSVGGAGARSFPPQSRRETGYRSESLDAFILVVR